MRVLLAPSAYYPHVGGIEELTRQLALALQTRGHETAVLTNRWPNGVVESELLGGVEVTRLPFLFLQLALHKLSGSSLRQFRLRERWQRWVRGWQADVVHVIGAGPQSVYLGMLAGRLGSTAALHHPRRAELRRSPMYSKGRRRFVPVCAAPCVKLEWSLPAPRSR